MRFLMKAALLAGFTFSGFASIACPNFATPANRSFDKPACLLDKGPYKSDITLTADKVWVLRAQVAIGGDNTDSATLFVEADTKIVGERADAYLLIRRGSKIVARGNRLQPIVFTSSKPEGQRSRGDWGGVVINGNAPVNGCGRENDPSQVCELPGEGASGLYGGNNAADSSGVLSYVRVEYAGTKANGLDELNGIAFQGVGAGTEVDFVQVHMGFDDGMEFFGGTVNVRHIVLTGNKDDSMDWVHGWQGKAQFVYIKQSDDVGNNGIEADNFDDKTDSFPRSQPTLSNLTIIGSKVMDNGASGHGILLREGTGANIYSAIVTGFRQACINIDDNDTFSHGAIPGNLSIDTSIVHCDKNFDEQPEDLFKVSDWFFDGFDNFAEDPLLNGYMPTADSPALGFGEPPADDFFEFVDFIGAFDEGDDWTAGWTETAVR